MIKCAHMALRVRACIHTYIGHGLDIEEDLHKWHAASVALILRPGQHEASCAAAENRTGAASRRGCTWATAGRGAAAGEAMVVAARPPLAAALLGLLEGLDADADPLG